ncbi:MAG: undecaprenyldiphospho-muramoylpentapeptide beta-N-acetylglucosaminyltransferase [Bacteroidales bacterium]|nr:undecaprenyldiphospho-muramoylpentapeptide beta-N-acetylglucosaminyltransferase [Bacteroidales bacterium]MBN2817974.1 undecaprenyldiphospho-muramoylpentapeptide beta-N-acetylglucosaminyltransferase [Bacteroidales bacterium]
MKSNLRIIISGGGTGGHIFPALAIADEVKRRYSDADILFVGAESRMEMERVPAAGYQIVGLPVQGLKRKLSFENIKVILNFLKSQRMAKKIVKDFKPDLAVGVGGYASAPLIRAAAQLHIPCLLQEQNSYAGLSNKLLAKKAKTICVAYDKMDRYFPADKIVNTGNPVRKIAIKEELKAEGYRHFSLSGSKPVLFIMGGSLGARTLNNAVVMRLEEIKNTNIEILWQTGKYYYNKLKEEIGANLPQNLHMMDFVSRMDLAYNVSDLVVSRAGALSLSELCLVKKPSVLVPSPNVAEDHQTKNALALAEKGAALMIRDQDAEAVLLDKAFELIADVEKLEGFAAEAGKLAKPNATEDIVDELIKLLK